MKKKAGDSKNEETSPFVKERWEGILSQPSAGFLLSQLSETCIKDIYKYSKSCLPTKQDKNIMSTKSSSSLSWGMWKGLVAMLASAGTLSSAQTPISGGMNVLAVGDSVVSPFLDSYDCTIYNQFPGQPAAGPLYVRTYDASSRAMKVDTYNVTDNGTTFQIVPTTYKTLQALFYLNKSSSQNAVLLCQPSAS